MRFGIPTADAYRDRDGDTWERQPDGLYRVAGGSNADALTLKRLRAAFGPLTPVKKENAR